MYFVINIKIIFSVKDIKLPSWEDQARAQWWHKVGETSSIHWIVLAKHKRKCETSHQPNKTIRKLFLMNYWCFFITSQLQNPVCQLESNSIDTHFCHRWMICVGSLLLHLLPFPGIFHQEKTERDCQPSVIAIATLVSASGSSKKSCRQTTGSHLGIG